MSLSENLNDLKGYRVYGLQRVMVGILFLV